eukprot:1914308-Prymnesium_polylepis.1
MLAVAWLMLGTAARTVSAALRTVSVHFAVAASTVARWATAQSKAAWRTAVMHSSAVVAASARWAVMHE